MLSAYYVNELGLLVYSGLPIEATDLQAKHFNGKKYSKFSPTANQLEVYAVGPLNFLHGIQGAKKLGLRYVLIQNCYRVI